MYRRRNWGSKPKYLSIPKSHKKFHKRQARRYKGQKRQEAREAKNKKKKPETRKARRLCKSTGNRGTGLPAKSP